MIEAISARRAGSIMIAIRCVSVAVAQARAVQEQPPSAARAQPCARDALIAAAGRGAGATVPADMGRMAVAAAACDVEILGPPPFETDV
jgi:hypothetical protein